MTGPDLHAIPAVWMRGGTSKGLFFHGRDLPAARVARERVILAALGSPDPYVRQLDGVGGATSSTSKAVIITPSIRPDSDVDYLFAHVAIERAVVNWSGNCGNLSAAVGVFAVEQDLSPAGTGPHCVVRVWQANLGQRLRVHVPVDGVGRVQTQGDYVMAGVPGRGARIAVDFLAASDDIQSRVLPTGHAREVLEIDSIGAVEVSLIMAGNATVFVAPEALGLRGIELPATVNARPDILARAEAIRACAAVRMGLVRSLIEAATRPATPKLALVSAPAAYRTTAGEGMEASAMDLCVRMFSMGQLHHAVTATGAVAVAVAARIPGTVVAAVSTSRCAAIRIGHCAGITEVDALVDASRAQPRLERATLYRTARSLMRGEVLVPNGVVR